MSGLLLDRISAKTVHMMLNQVTFAERIVLDAHIMRSVSLDVVPFQMLMVRCYVENFVTTSLNSHYLITRKDTQENILNFAKVMRLSELF